MVQRILGRVKQWGWPQTAMAVLWIYFLAVGLKGIHYEKHWDENKLLLSASFAAKDKRLYPGWYNYPSLPFDITLAICHGMGLKFQLTEDKKVPSQIDFALNARTAFVILSSFIVLAVGRIGSTLGRSPWVGVIAAGFVATQWQIGYHARYVAPDMLMAMLALWAIALLLIYAQKGKWRTLIFASLLAGLALGSKYPAGLLILPLIYAIWVQHRQLKQPWWKIGIPLGLAMVLWAGIFLLSSPGIIQQYVKFKMDLAFEMNHYASGHRGHNVVPWTEHPARIFQYFAYTGFAESFWLSAALLGFAVTGVIFLFRQQKQAAVILLLFPLVYFVYFSSQKVMIVRNYMVLIPILHILAAIGLWELGKWIKAQTRSRYWAATVYSLPLVVILLNGPQNWEKAESVKRDADEKRLSDHLEEYLQVHPDQPFWFSPMAEVYWSTHARFKEFPTTLRPAQDLPDDAFLVCYSLEATNLLDAYRANRPDYIEKIWGPAAADFRYYPFWLSNYLLIMPAKYAKELEFKDFQTAS